jgi:hypothetical protein
MKLERVRERISNGFRPFVVLTCAGKRFEFPRPESLAVGKGVVLVLGNNDWVSIPDALHIVTVEDLPRRSSGRRR